MLWYQIFQQKYIIFLDNKSSKNKVSFLQLYLLGLFSKCKGILNELIFFFPVGMKLTHQKTFVNNFFFDTQWQNQDPTQLKRKKIYFSSHIYLPHFKWKLWIHRLALFYRYHAICIFKNNKWSVTLVTHFLVSKVKRTYK